MHNLIISSSPHQRSPRDISYIMFQVIYALIPVVLFSLWLFRQHAFFLILNCVITAIITEGIVLKFRKKPSRLFDGSSILTGLLLALTLPPSIKWYAASLGSIFAVVVGKHLFGGLGNNIFNPALMGRAFLMAAYPKMLSTWTTPLTLQTVTGATPLALRKFQHILSPLKQLFIGNVTGSLGETSALLIILGGLYLLIRKIADWRIPFSFILTVGVVSEIFYLINPINGSLFFHLFSGGVMLGAFFMATDPVTTPTTKRGRWFFGIGCGILVMIIRYFSGLPEGVMYSILFMNALTPLINRYTRSAPFGYRIK